MRTPTFPETIPPGSEALSAQERRPEGARKQSARVRFDPPLWGGTSRGWAGQRRSGTLAWTRRGETEEINARQGSAADTVLFRKLGQPWPRIAYSGKHIFVSGLLCPRCGVALHALVPRSAEAVVNRSNLEELLRAVPSCRHD
jgi:hypothetical protein